MDFYTSTPLISSKPQSSRVKTHTEDKINQRLFINTNINCNHNISKIDNNNNGSSDDQFFDEKWEEINGPRFVDFAKGIPEPRDSFFDGRQLICPTPVKEEEKMHFDNEVIETLENFSLGSDQDQDVTLKADSTALEQSIVNCTTPTVDRRFSRLPTAPRPFSFESREKEKQERKLARKQYLMSVTQQPAEFKARAAPKLKNVPKNPIKQIMKEDKRILQDFIPNKNLQGVAGVKREAKPVVNIKGTIKEEITSPVESYPVSTADKSVSCTAKDLDYHLASQNKYRNGGAESDKKKVEAWNQKPFQISLPKRRILVPKSPKLRTAERAKERKLFEEKLKLRELEFEEMRKTLSESQREKERDELVRLRLMTTFKARPMPKYPDVKVSVPFKRPLADPTAPLNIKRPRIGSSKQRRYL